MKLSKIWILPAELILAAACVFTVLGQVPSESSIFLLLGQFPLQYLAVQIPSLVALSFARRKLIVVVGVLITAVNLVLVAPLWLPQSPDRGTGERLRVLQMNLLFSNQNHQAALECIARNNPDILLCEELTDDWSNTLQRELKDYPYKLISTREDPLGIGAFSRRPITRAQALYWHFSAAQLIFETELDGKPLGIVHVHMELPSKMQVNEMEELSELRPHLPKTLIVAGDLNTSTFTPAARKMLRETGLRDSQEGFGFQPTWPTIEHLKPELILLEPFIKVAIDHFLVSRDLVVLARRTGEDFGSDHKPVFLEVQRKAVP